MRYAIFDSSRASFKSFVGCIVFICKWREFYSSRIESQ